MGPEGYGNKVKGLLNYRLVELLCDWKYLQEESWTHVTVQDMGGEDSMLWPERSYRDTSTVETAASGEATRLDWDQRTKKVDA